MQQLEARLTSRNKKFLPSLPGVEDEGEICDDDTRTEEEDDVLVCCVELDDDVNVVVGFVDVDTVLLLPDD